MQCTKCNNDITSSAVYCPYCGARVEGAVEEEDYVYEAFISYRHLPHDRSVAKRVQHFLEGAVIPKELRTDRVRLGRLFRDEDELVAASSLSDSIVEALKKSRFLIVICSPKLRESPWVLNEVETFASLHGRDRILIVLAEGEPSESFPPLLLSRHSLDEETGEYVEVPAEPLGADMRVETKKDFSREALRLEASMLGCGYDDLQQRIRLRRMRTNLVISLVLVVASVAFGIFAYIQRQEIATNLRQSQINESRMLARSANEMLNDGDRIEALRASLSALPDKSAENTRPYVSDAQLALERALSVFPNSTPWEGLYIIDGASTAYDSRDGLQAMGGLGDTVTVSSVATGGKTLQLTPYDNATPTNTTNFILSNLKFGEDTLLCQYGTQLYCIEIESGDMQWEDDLMNAHESANVKYLEKTRQFVLLSQTPERGGSDVDKIRTSLTFFDELTGSVVQTISLYGLPTSGDIDFAISDDETTFALAVGDGESNSGGHAYLVAFERPSNTSEKPQMLRTRLSGPFVFDLDVEDGCLIATTLTGDMYGGECNATYEVFDSSLERKWAFDDPLSDQYVYLDKKTGLKAQVVGVVQGDEEQGKQLVCANGAQLMTLDFENGTLLDFDFIGEGILAASLLSNADDEVVVVGCTDEGSVFARDPTGTTGLQNSVYDHSFYTTLTFAYPIFQEGFFQGFAAWAPGSQRMHIYALADYRPREELQQYDYDQWLIGDTGLVFLEDNAVHMLDPTSFMERWSVTYDSLGISSKDYMKAAFGNTSFCVVSFHGESDSKTAVKVLELSDVDGSIRSSFEATLSDFSSSRAQINNCKIFELPNGARRLVLQSSSEVCVLDLDTHEKIFSRTFNSSVFILDEWVGTDSIVFQQVIGNTWSLAPYSLETGEVIDSPLSRQALDNSFSSSMVLAGKKQDTMVVKCYDGLFRGFSLSSGKLVWESSKKTKDARFLAYVGDDLIIFQDALGRSYLLDDTNGKVLASSQIVLPVMSDCARISDGDGIAAIVYNMKGMEDSKGLAVFNLDEDNFGPISDACYGIYLSADKSKVLCSVPWTEMNVVYPRYDLDDMIQQAKDILAEFDYFDND